MFKKEIEFLKALANGVNVFTGEQCENDSILNDPNIIRSLFALCDRLNDISNDSSSKGDFKTPQDLKEKFQYEDEMNLTSILKQINQLYPNMKRPKLSLITDELKRRNLLVTQDVLGKSTSFATDNAVPYGIYNKEKISLYGKPYNGVMYNRKGQEFVISLLYQIAK